MLFVDGHGFAGLPIMFKSLPSQRIQTCVYPSVWSVLCHPISRRKRLAITEDRTALKRNFRVRVKNKRVRPDLCPFGNLLVDGWVTHGTDMEKYNSGVEELMYV